MDEVPRHTKEIEVLETHLDLHNHVNNIVYLQWVQDISAEHWKMRTSADMQARYVWMVLEHHIKYKKQALLGDSLKIVTYVKAMEGVRSIRQVEIWKGDTLLVETQSHWCMLDTETLRPKRVPDDVKALFK